MRRTLTLAFTLALWAPGCKQNSTATVTTEVAVDAAALVRSLATNPFDSLVNTALWEAHAQAGGENELEAFGNIFRRRWPGKMAASFTGAGPAATDEEVIRFIAAREAAALSRSSEIMKLRAAKLKIDVAIKPGADAHTLSVTLPAADTAAMPVMISMGRLEFFEAYSNEDLATAIQAANDTIIRRYNPPPAPASQEAGSIDELVKKQKSLFSVLLLNPPADGRSAALGHVLATGKETLDKYLGRKEVMNCFPANTAFRFSSGIANSAGEVFYALYAIKMPASGKAILDGSAITSVDYEVAETGEESLITMKMNEAATQLWSNMTARNVGKFIAVTYDLRMVTCPRVDNVISSGTTQITGGFTQQEAKNMSAMLSSGILPYPLHRVNTVAPSK